MRTFGEKEAGRRLRRETCNVAVAGTAGRPPATPAASQVVFRLHGGRSGLSAVAKRLVLEQTVLGSACQWLAVLQLPGD
jgi:hypothetical protein